MLVNVSDLEKIPRSSKVSRDQKRVVILIKVPKIKKCVIKISIKSHSYLDLQNRNIEKQHPDL